MRPRKNLSVAAVGKKNRRMATKKTIRAKGPPRQAKRRIKQDLPVEYDASIKAVIGTPPVKKEHVPDGVGVFIPKSRDIEMGLKFADTGHLLWVWDGGSLKSWPYKVLRAIMFTWNPLVCLLAGHDTFGPLYDKGEFIKPRTCMHCCKTWET